MCFFFLNEVYVMLMQRLDLLFEMIRSILISLP